MHALGDATGKEVMRAVIDRACARDERRDLGKRLHARFAHARRTLPRALVWSAEQGKTLVWAKQTILCTGGTGQIYRETTNPEVATGDGLAIAYRAGAELRDMEFMQFHPTVLYIAGSSRSLITEAMRGEGARLVDRNGHRFMPEYDPRGELAPRDVVSRAIVTQMERTRHPNVYLDLTHLDPAAVRARFPGIAATCAEFGLDITRDWIPVRPGAHYMIGGVTVDIEGRTTLPGLVGGRRVHLQRPARRESPGVQQPAGRAGLRRACRRPERPARRPAIADDFRALPLSNPPLEEGDRAVGPGRHSQFAQEPDVAQRRRAPRPRAPGRGGREHRPLVRLRAGPAVRRHRAAGSCRTC